MKEENINPRRMNYIGKQGKVVDARNKSLIDINGLIIDETQKTIKLLIQDNEVKIILKNGTKLLIEGYLINGKDIMKRQVDRISMKIRKVFKIRQEPLMV